MINEPTKTRRLKKADREVDFFFMSGYDGDGIIPRVLLKQINERQEFSVSRAVTLDLGRSKPARASHEWAENLSYLFRVRSLISAPMLCVAISNELKRSPDGSWSSSFTRFVARQRGCRDDCFWRDLLSRASCAVRELARLAREFP